MGNWNLILTAALMIGGMGLIFGAVLAIVGRIFAVKEDPRKAEVREVLPGANCGGCGFAGCDAYAQAIAEGKVEVNRCPVAGEKGAAAIAQIMGVEAGAMEKKVAIVRCRGSLDQCGLRFEYDGPKDCKSAALVAAGDKNCQYSCLGFGDCEAACPFDAIHVTSGRLAAVDVDKCRGCGVCVAACPRGVLQLRPAEHPVHSTCSAMEKGKVVRDNCTAGCIGCGKCAKMCKFGALTLKNNLPEIDLEKCVGCMQCADNCPTGALAANDALRRHAVIHYPDCTGCGDCKAACLFDAIAGEPSQRHSVIEWNCVGCAKCFDACTHGCIEMLPGGIYKRR
ncbi:MAG TPA: RnfABCDGE type electron transport complex subunit B [Candidatus Pullichristensenella excrementigallinarum]|uniref:Ion-translocating oxidoreductase complex subunit B n=1 Tax=Candidatus Pullichristensenella excrementigallinarum TaxID=2840907 RepID=A0A9D1IBK9_9FIRM|nr:RnfABCDGE type electron transport complex subunit B [Candidatus Pullichristensenella excrementigallinarum]